MPRRTEVTRVSGRRKIPVAAAAMQAAAVAAMPTTTRTGSGGGRGRGGSDRENGASFVANMNPQLRARLGAMLPSGVTLEQAAEGFRNQGQFIAALQQSQNHDISFGDLKAQMTGDNPLSLGEAMRKLGVETDED